MTMTTLMSTRMPKGRANFCPALNLALTPVAMPLEC
jgi:hypothetical protein